MTKDLNNDLIDGSLKKLNSQHVILVHQPHEDLHNSINLKQIVTSFLSHWRAFLVCLILFLIPTGYLSYKASQLSDYSELVSVPTIYHTVPGAVTRVSLFPADELMTQFNLQYLSVWQSQHVPYASPSLIVSNILSKGSTSAPQQLTPQGTLLISVKAPAKSQQQIRSLFDKIIGSLQSITHAKLMYWNKGMQNMLQQQQQTVSMLEASLKNIQKLNAKSAVDPLSEPHLLMIADLQKSLINAKNAVSAQQWLISSLDDQVKVVVPMVQQPVDKIRIFFVYLVACLVAVMIATFLWIGIFSLIAQMKS